jgi:leucyl-tRNA synthetase
MELVNALYAFEAASLEGVPAGERQALMREAVETITLLLAPFCPHVTEEIWSLLGHEGSVFHQPWPVADQSALVRDEVTLVVQVDGKVRSRLVVEAGTAQDRIERLALDDDKIRPWVASRRISRVVVVQNRLVNIVTAA